MLRNCTIGLGALAFILLVTGSIDAKLQASRSPGVTDQTIASLAPRQRELIRQIEVNDCRDRVISGRDSRLDASDSPEGRSELRQNSDLVASYCGCKFDASSGFLTQRDVVTRWLSSGAAQVPTEDAASAPLDRVARDCAETLGLRTLPPSENG